MIGSTKRRLFRASGLAILLVLGALTWPAANLRAEDSQGEPTPTDPSKQPPSMPEPRIPRSPAPSLTVPPPRPTPPVSEPVSDFRPSGLPPSQQPQRFPVTIDPNTPLKDLLPARSKIKNFRGILPDDLAQVPEVEIGAPVAKDGNAAKNTALTIAKINHLNAKKADGFVEALRDDRPDLHGLPFAMGDNCRTKGERSQQFADAVRTARALLQEMRGDADQFWATYQRSYPRGEGQIDKSDKALCEHDLLARIAALMQIMGPESPGMRLGLVKYLSTISHVEATRALAKLAVFAPKDEVRQAAIDALKVRRERDYTDVLLQGMRYPWPAIAKYTGEAVVKLERKDLVPQLIEMLDEPDPRLPVVQEVNQKKVAVVRELVRINHHRNCLLCHAPGNTEGVAAETLTAAVPTPDQPLTPPSGGYRQSGSPDLLVRIDVTYLRQDFSVKEAVADAAPWPEMQRFDFLVRTREVTGKEAAALRSKLEKSEKGQITPYQRAAVTALRDLTGKDTGPTAQAWRELLDMRK